MPIARKTSRASRVLGAGLAVLTACASPERTAEDTTAVPAQTPAVTATQTAAPAASPGEEWLDAMSGNALLAALNDGSRWVRSTDSPKQRRCASGPCGPAGPAVVNLWVERNAHNVGDSMAGDTAILVGKLRRVSGGESRMYRVRPGPYIYALFILTGSATQGRYQVREVNTSTGQHTAHAAGDWIRCNHTRQTTASAYFRDCNPPHAPSDDQAAVTHEDPAWFTCTSGCCTAGSLEP